MTNRKQSSGCTVASTLIALSVIGCADDDPEQRREQARAGFPEIVNGTIPDYSNVVREPGPGKEVTPDDEFADEPSNKAGGFLLKSAQSAAETFTWSVNADQTCAPDVPMKPVNTHVCFLTRVSGNFAQPYIGGTGVAVHRHSQNMFDFCSAGDALDFFNNEASPVWKLGGAHPAFANSLAAEATCVPGSSFILDPDGVVVQSRVAVASVGGSCTNTDSASLWTYPAISFIAAIGGEMHGGGEKVEIVSDPYSWTQSKLNVRSEYCGAGAGMVATAYSLFAGPVNLTQASHRKGPYKLEVKDGQSKTVTMQPTSKYACYMTKISGSLDGGGERLRIYPKIDAAGVEQWMFEARSQYGGSAYGAAECIEYDQRWRPLN